MEVALYLLERHMANGAGFHCLVVTGVEKVTHTGTEWTTNFDCSDFFYEGQEVHHFQVCLHQWQELT